LNETFNEIPQDQVLAFTRNKSIDEIQQAKTIFNQIKTEYKGNDFQKDIVAFVKEYKTNPQTL